MKRFVREQTVSRIETLRDEMDSIAEQPDEADPLHRTRVAARRLQQCLELFGDYLHKLKVSKLQRRIRKLVKATGSVRTCDITLGLLKSAGVRNDRLKKQIEHQRAHLQKDLATHVDKLHHKSVWHHPAKLRVSKRSKGAWDMRQTPAANARRVLPGMVETWFNAGDETLTGGHDALHRFRLSGKRLRYTLELFADLYANKIEPPLDGLRSVQDRLGSIQDCVASMPLLNGNSRAEAAIQRLLAMREQDFRTYWLANISKQRELWIASLEGTEESNGALSSSPRKSRAARTR